MSNVVYPTPCVICESSRGIDRVPIVDQMLARREIECVGEIDEALTYSLCQQLRQLAFEDPNTPITLFINSPGGSVQDGLAVYDTMQAIPCQIRTVCMGKAASMAALLFMCGDQRDMLAHSRVMIHDPLIAGNLGGSALELKVLSDNLMRTRQITAEVISHHTGHTVEEVLEATMHDTWFEASQAVEWGIADRVIDSL